MSYEILVRRKFLTQYWKNQADKLEIVLILKTSGNFVSLPLKIIINFQIKFLSIKSTNTYNFPLINYEVHSSFLKLFPTIILKAKFNGYLH